MQRHIWVCGSQPEFCNHWTNFFSLSLMQQTHWMYWTISSLLAHLQLQPLFQPQVTLKLLPHLLNIYRQLFPATALVAWMKKKPPQLHMKVVPARATYQPHLLKQLAVCQWQRKVLLLFSLSFKTLRTLICLACFLTAQAIPQRTKLLKIPIHSIPILWYKRRKLLTAMAYLQGFWLLYCSLFWWW